MPSNLVPKVILTETASSLAGGGIGQVILGIIGTSEKGPSATVTLINSTAEANSIFGSNTAYGATLVKMISRAFSEGASVIKAVSIGAPTLDAATSGANASKSILTAAAVAGATTITVTDGSAYLANKVVYIGTGNTYGKEEVRKVVSITGAVVTLDAPLSFDHSVGETAVIVTAKVTGDYTNAINALLPDETKNIIVSEANDAATAAAIKTMCESSASLYSTPCVYIKGPEASDTEATSIAKAQVLNSKRVVSVYPLLADFSGVLLTGGETAATVAGAIAGNGVPKLNHNFTTFSNVGGVASRISDYDALIAGGVSPIELKYNTIHIVRFVTTYSTLNGVPDATWKEASVRLNVDHIQRTLTRRVQGKFLQSGNTPQIRLAIKTEAIAVLNQYAADGILVADERTGTPAFRDPIVSTDANDNTKVNVDIELSPGKPLNFISLNFRIFV